MPDEVLFYEQGASWRWLLLGPIAALMMFVIQHRAGMGFAPIVPLFFLVLLCGVLYVQVRAARLHTSVELTADHLRQGTEVLPLAEIVTVYPETPNAPKSGKELHAWQEARSLGELNGVPKGRRGIGLRLAGGRTAQAWARDDDELRELLTRLVDGQ
ncbi:MAG: DUF3093 domain-containing protein [Mycobacterium sp.]|jgi:hypothetical protein